jgi:hypothetical protein
MGVSLVAVFFVFLPPPLIILIVPVYLHQRFRHAEVATSERQFGAVLFLPCMPMLVDVNRNAAIVKCLSAAAAFGYSLSILKSYCVLTIRNGILFKLIPLQ